ncbi:MAG: PHB depolymerase family esterase [Candidatus Sericytochromatia bacterium]|nr:PHB depolymerase family esterase [Candidatus Sericytochromatia bacterium]
MRISLGLVLLSVGVAGCGLVASPAPPARPAGEMVAAAARGSFRWGEFDGRRYKLFAPSGVRGARPLVVMLHGCTQDPDDFATGTGMNALAAREGFYVLYPEQTLADQPKACWRFYDPPHQLRGMGEAAAIVGMVDRIRQAHAIDPGATYLAGLSAGGAYAAVMAALYPDRFAAVGIHSGLEYGVALNWVAAKLAMKVGGPDPLLAGGAAYLAMGLHRRVVPAMVVHGSRDEVVIPRNGEQVVRQLLVMNDWARDGLLNDDIDRTPDARRSGQVEGGYPYTRTVYADREGQPVVEHVEVNGLGHAWSGGRAGGTYADAKGPDVTAWLWEFFKAHRRKALD